MDGWTELRKGILKRRLAETLKARADAVETATRMAREATRFRLVCEAIPQSLIVCDERDEVQLSNHNGFDQQRWSPLVDGAIGELLRCQPAKDGVTRRVELRGPPPKLLAITAMPLEEGDERFGTVAFVDDLSERRQLEQLRRDFIANVSHELRTPIGALGLLGEALAGETDVEVVTRLADRIATEAYRAGRMIEDLLDLSRIEAHGLRDLQLVAVDGVVRSAIERVRSMADRKGVEVSPPRVTHSPQVPGDEAQLVSAVSNLLDNAVKYSDGGSPVKVKIRVTNDGWVEVSVRDKGIGIPAKDLQRIFERFYRVDRARSRQTGGTGLGLSIVRHVAENHGGEVTVESSEGAGSTFVLRLPAAPARAEDLRLASEATGS